MAGSGHQFNMVIDTPLVPIPRYEVESLAIDTNYYMIGEPQRAPLLLMHGMSTSGDSFRELMHGLADDYWLIAPDIPGFGFSESTEPFTLPHLVEWLASFVEKLELPAVYLLGHSFGGIIASSFALAYPHHVEKLVLLAPAIIPGDNFPQWVLTWSQTRTALNAVKLGNALMTSPIWLERQIRSQFYAPSRHHDYLWERRRLDYRNARSSPDVIMAVAQENYSSRINEIEQPVLLIWGQQDTVLRVVNVERITERLPQADIHLLDECGHVPMIEQPEQVQQLIQTFLEGSES